MSDNDIGLNSAVCMDVQHALDHLRLAQNIVDELDRPEIGARLNEVIDLLDDCLSGLGLRRRRSRPQS